MKQAKLTHEQIQYLKCNGYIFTSRYYYWKLWDDTNIVNRITREEFMERSIAEPLQGVEQIRIYERGKKQC